MATYAFKAIDLAGAPSRGEVEGPSEQTVSEQLRSRGLIVLNIAEQKPTDVGDLLERFRRVKPRELTILSRQLATMIASGMPLLRALHVLEDQVEGEKLRRTLVDVRKRVESGSSLSDALASHPRVFNQLYVSMVRAGETGGILEDTLRRVADQLESADSLRRQIRAAMAYPVLIGTFALGVLIALVAFLIPVFEKVFKDIAGKKAELPPTTKISVAASHLITQRWYVVIAGLVVIVIAFRRWKRSSWGRPQWDSFKLRIPFRIGGVVHKVALARFSRTFAGLTASGVPILETIDITGKTAGNAVIEEAMGQVRESVRSGGTIAAPMRAAQRAFPAMVTHMVGVGEETGALESMLDKIADFYEDEVAAAVKALASLLEPVMIVLVGAMVGFIVISMYLPLFQLYDKIR